MRKILAILLALTMVVGLAASAMAASITIDQNPENGTAGNETYEFYKIFDVTKTAETNGNTNDQNVGDQYEAATTYAAGAKYYTRALNDAGEYVYTAVTTITDADTFATALAEATDGLWKLVVEDGVSYTIAENNPWFAVIGSVTDGVWSPANGQNWVILTATGKTITGANNTEVPVWNVTWKPGVDATEEEAIKFADWLYSNKGTIAADETVTDAPGTTTTVDPGYYLIKSSLGTNLILATSDIKLTTKNSFIVDKKEGPSSNYEIGDIIPFTITIDVPASTDFTKPIRVHDTMSDVLSLVDGSLTYTVDGATATNPAVNLVLEADFDNEHNNTAHPVTENAVRYDFVITFGANTTEKDYKIVINYKAELTSGADPDTGYFNKEFTEYSKYKTTENKIEIKTYDFDIKKTFNGEEDEDVLAELSATFNLFKATYELDDNGTYYKLKDNVGTTEKPDYRYTTVAPTFDTYIPKKDANGADLKDDDGNVIYTNEIDTLGTIRFYEVKADTLDDDGNPVPTKYKASATTPYAETDIVSLVEDNGNYSFADSDDATTTNDIVVNGIDLVNVKGLSEGVYYLKEIETADGYNLLTSEIVITVDKDGGVTATLNGASVIKENDDKVTYLDIENNSGTVLPSTGGIGTTIFYVVGGLLAVGAGVVLVTKKRMSKEDV